MTCLRNIGLSFSPNTSARAQSSQKTLNSATQLMYMYNVLHTKIDKVWISPLYPRIDCAKVLEIPLGTDICNFHMQYKMA